MQAIILKPSLYDKLKEQEAQQSEQVKAAIQLLETERGGVYPR